MWLGPDQVDKQVSTREHIKLVFIIDTEAHVQVNRKHIRRNITFTIIMYHRSTEKHFACKHCKSIMDSDSAVEGAYYAYAKLLSALLHANTQDLQFHGPIITEYVPSSDLLVENRGPQALDPAHPANHQLLMIQADSRDLFALLKSHSSIQWQDATHSVLLSLKHLDNVCWQLEHPKGSHLKCLSRLFIAVGLIQQEYFLSGLTGYTDKLFSTPVVELNHLMGQLCVALLVYVASYMSQGSLEHLQRTKLIHERSKISCESNCGSGNEDKSVGNSGNKGRHLVLCYAKYQTFIFVYWFYIDFRMRAGQWISFVARP